MDYPKIDTTVGLYNGKFTDGNPAGGIPASKDPSSWANNVTDELLAILAAASITPNETVSNQVVTAIQELITSTSARSPSRMRTMSPSRVVTRFSRARSRLHTTSPASR